MGRSQRFKAKSALVFGFKSIGILVLLSCATKDTKPERVEKEYTEQEDEHWIVHTPLGENFDLQLSKNENYLVYSSRKRTLHKTSQIYIKDLNSGSERRVTHNDGDNLSPQFSSDSRWLSYLSSTDRIKEDLSRLSDKKQRSGEAALEPSKDFEIYLSRRSGSQIVRLTNNNVTEKSPHYHAKNKRLIYLESSNDRGFSRLRNMSLRTKGVTTFKNVSTEVSDISVSPSQKYIALIEDGSIVTTMSLRGKANRKSFTPLPDKKWSEIRWTHDEMSILLVGEKKEEIFEFWPATGCIDKIELNTKPISSPQIPKKRDKMYLASKRSSWLQIYEIPYVTSEKCKDVGTTGHNSK